MFLRTLMLSVFLLGGLVVVVAAPAKPPPAANAATLATLHQRAASGDAAAEVALGHRLLDSTDRVASTAWFRKAAIQGNAEGEWMLGSAYMAGLGVAHDVPTALQWMRKSLPDGPADHMATYGFFAMLWGRMSGDDEDGATWLRRSARDGSTRGMEILGTMLLSGNMGIAKDPHAAEQWLLKAARLGDASAQSALGRIYVFGLLGHADAGAGMRWLREAAQQGDADAEGTLGVLLITGQKQVPKNPVEGVQWARKAVAKNNPLGYYALGLAYQLGEGEPQEPARAWYDLAVAQRLDVKHELSKVGDHLSEVATALPIAQIHRLQARVAKIPLPKAKGLASMQ